MVFPRWLRLLPFLNSSSNPVQPPFTSLRACLRRRLAQRLELAMLKLDARVLGPSMVSDFDF